MPEVAQFQYPIYFIAVTLFIFLYGSSIIFWIVKDLKKDLRIKNQLVSFLTFISLVLVISLFTDNIANWLINSERFGLWLVVFLYLATYYKHEQEMKKK